MNELDTQGWNKVYRDLEKVIGLDATLSLFKEYRGMQLNFPIRLISRHAMIDILRTEYTGLNKQDLARRYGYSQRSIERMLREIRNESANKVEEESLPYYLADFDKEKKEE